jgi:hypothetical protein
MVLLRRIDKKCCSSYKNIRSIKVVAPGKIWVRFYSRQDKSNPHQALRQNKEIYLSHTARGNNSKITKLEHHWRPAFTTLPLIWLLKTQIGLQIWLNNRTLKSEKWDLVKWQQPTNPFDPIYRSNKKTKIPLCAENKITVNQGKFGPTSTAPHLMPSNRPSFTSLSRDLCDDAMCTIRRRSSTSFEEKLGKPSPTCFVTKQAARYRHVSSHHLHLLIGFEAQTNKPPPLGSEVKPKTVTVILRPKSPNRRHRFWIIPKIPIQIWIDWNLLT